MKKTWEDYWFACIEGIASTKKMKIHERINISELFHIEEIGVELKEQGIISEKELDRINASRGKRDWEVEFSKAKEKGIKVITYFDECYPNRLKQHSGMPYALFLKGQLIEETKKTVAIVGARRSSAYGETMTLEFAEALCEQGIQIVSGMALGIDSLAHRAALNKNGITNAVLGCGVDVCYPKENKGLYLDLQTKGGIISEYPPGTIPLARHFPARNRIISGLADFVLVMEAKEKSGSLITADMALEQGKDIYALPGPVDKELSKGCNRLIYQGAGILLSTDILLEDLGFSYKALEKDCENKIMLESKEELVYSCLGLVPKNREEIMRETNLEPSELAMILMDLELKGLITERSKNYYLRRKR